MQITCSERSFKYLSNDISIIFLAVIEVKICAVKDLWSSGSGQNSPTRIAVDEGQKKKQKNKGQFFLGH